MVDVRSPVWNGGTRGSGFNDEFYGRRLQLLYDSGARYLAPDTNSLVDLAAGNLSDMDMVDVFHRAQGQVGVLKMRDTFEGMPQLWQEGEFARLTRTTQNLMRASGYRLPVDEERDTNLVDRILEWEFPIIEGLFEDAGTPLRAALFPFRAMGKAIAVPTQKAWSDLNWMWDRVRQAGNTALGVHERTDWMQVPGAGFGAQVPTSWEFLNPGTWIESWNAVADEKDAYTDAALAQAEDLIGSTRVGLMRIYLRDGVEGVAEKFEEIGMASGKPRDQIARAFTEWYGSLGRPGETEAMEVLGGNRRDLSSSYVALYNRSNYGLPDVRPGTKPAILVGGVPALATEILLDPLTWAGTIWTKVIKAARMGLVAGSTRNQIYMWKRFTDFFREAEILGLSGKKGLTEYVARDPELAAFVAESGGNFVARTFLNIRAQSTAMNRFIERINETFRFMDEYDDTKRIVWDEWIDAGKTEFPIEELEAEILVRMGEVAHPVEQLLRDIPAIQGAWDHMLGWHRARRAQVAVVGVAGEAAEGQMRLLGGAGHRIRNVQIGDEVVEVLDEPLEAAKWAMRSPLPTLSTPDGYWQFLSESAEGMSALAGTMGGVDPAMMLLPRISQFGRAWVWGKKMVNKPIDFLNPSTEVTAEVGRLVSDYLADEFALVTTRVAELAVGLSKRIDEDMVARLVASPTQATAKALGLTLDDMEEILRIHKNMSGVVRQELFDQGMLDDLLNWYGEHGYQRFKRDPEKAAELIRRGQFAGEEVRLPGAPFSSARRAATNYYKSRIHPPGGVNDELSWLEHIKAIPGATAIGLSYYPARFARKLTTYVPKKGYMDVLDADNAVSEFTKLVEMGMMAHMPRTEIDRMIRLFATGNESQRWLVQTEFFMDFLGRSGALVNGGKHLEKFVDRFLRHADARYSFLSDDVVGFRRLNMRRAVIPGVEHAAEFSRLNVIPNYRQLGGLARHLSFYRKIGWGLHAPQIDNMFARTWRPAVLLRLGYVARNGGEELFSWMLREGPSGYANHRLGRTALDMEIMWDGYGRKVLKEVKPEESQSILARGPLRVWRSINELSGVGDFSLTLKGIEKAMFDPDNINRWKFMTSEQRMEAFVQARKAVVRETEQGFIARQLRHRFMEAEAVGQKLSYLFHKAGQRIPGKWDTATGKLTQADIARMLGKRFDSNHDERVRLIRLSMTNPTIMDSYMRNVLSTYDTYTNFEGLHLDSMLRKAGFGTPTQQMLKLPLNYEKMKLQQVVNRGAGDVDAWDKGVAATQRLTYLSGDPGSRGALFEMAHFVSPAQDAVGGDLHRTMGRLIDADPELRTVRVAGREETAERLVDAEPGVVIETLEAPLGPGSNRERVIYDAGVRDARDRGDDVIETVVTTPVEEYAQVQDVTMKYEGALRAVGRGKKTADTRLANHWRGGRPYVGQIIRFVDSEGRAVYVRVKRVETLERTQRGQAWVRERTIPGQDLPQREVHYITNAAEARGEIAGIYHIEETADETGEIVSRRVQDHPGDVGYEFRNWNVPIEDDLRVAMRRYESEGFETTAEYQSHIRGLTQRSGTDSIIRTEFEKIDSVEHTTATIVAGGTSQSQRVIPGSPAVSPMGPSQFIWEELHYNHPNFIEKLSEAFDQGHLPMTLFDDANVQVSGTWDEVVENLLLLLPEETRYIWRDLFLPGVADTATGQILSIGKLNDRILAFLLHNSNPARFTNDWSEILTRMHAAYKAGLGTVEGQQMARSAARANIAYTSHGDRISDPLPPGYSRIFMPMLPIEHRAQLIQILSGTDPTNVGRVTWVEELDRRLKDAFHAVGRDHNPTIVSHLLHPQYGPDPSATALNYFRVSQEWADSGATHFPLIVASADPEVAKIVGEVLDEMLGPLPQRSRVGALQVNSETLNNTPGQILEERTLFMPDLTIEQTQGGIVSSITHAELGGSIDPILADPFYGWTDSGSVASSAFPGGNGVSKEYAFGMSSHLLNPGLEGVERIHYIDDVPQVSKQMVYRHKRDGREVQISAADERPTEWYDTDDWELVSEQWVTGHSLQDWIADSASRNIPEMEHFMSGVVQGVREVQHPWIREVLQTNKVREVSAERVLHYAEWDRAPKNLLAMIPATNEAGGKMEVPAKFWKTLLQNWFEGVVNPMIGSMVREPMFQHYLLIGTQQTAMVRRIYDLPVRKTTQLKSWFGGAGALDNEGQFMIPVLEDFITGAWLNVTSESPVMLRRLGHILDNENQFAFRNWLEEVLETAAKHEVDAYTKLLRLTENDEVMTNFFQWAKNRKLVTEVHRDVSLKRAFTLTGAYIDDHRIRSQFQEMVGTLLPFWFAEDNFLRRMGRGLRHNPKMVRNLHLVMMAGVYGGLIQEDSQGDKWLIYPGSDIATNFMLEIADHFPIVNKVVGGGLGVVANEPLASSLNILPGFDAERLGQPGFGPLLAIPINWMASRDPAIRSMYEPNLIGARYGSEKASDVVLGPIIPAVLARTAQVIGINWPDTRARDKAAMDVLRLLAIQDKLPSQEEIVALEQPELFEEHFLSKIDMMAHQYQMLQSLTWFGGFSTGSFSELLVHDGWEWSNEFHELLEAGVPYEEAYPMWIDRIEKDTGKEFNPMEYSPFHSSATTKRTFGVLEATAEANEWLVNNRAFVEDYGLSASFFMPRKVDSSDDRYSSEAKQRAVNYGLRDYKTPATFLSELYYQASYPEYHLRRVSHLARKYALTAAGLPSTNEDRKWTVWFDMWSNRNPVFSSRISGSDAQDRRDATLEEFRRLLAVPSLIPDGLHTEDLKEAMRTIVELDSLYARLKNDRTASAQRQRDSLKYLSYKFMERFIQGRPWLNEMYYSVFLPQLGDTWLAKLQAGVIDVPRLAA